MKIKIAALMTVICCLLLSAASAGFSDVFSVDGQTLSITAPPDSLVSAAPLGGNYSLAVIEQTENADGTRFVVLTVPEEYAQEDQLILAIVSSDGGYRLGTFEWVPGSGFITLGLLYNNGDIRVEYTGGYYDYSEDEVLYVCLSGSPYTGYEWTWIPDNSGTLDFIDEIEVDMTEGDTDIIDRTATGFFFETSSNAPSRKGSVIFEQTAAPEGQVLHSAVRVDYILDENGLITDFEVMRLER